MFIVKFTGVFAFIKPWTAVRDNETLSQQFLTPSMLEGIEKKLFPELLSATESGAQHIMRHRLNYQGIDFQQERTWSKGGLSFKKNRTEWKPELAVLKRGVLLHPHLYLAFASEAYAQRAATQTICLCRNEDLMFPDKPFECDAATFDTIPGFELFPTDAANGFKVGHNRFHQAEAMFGHLRIFGNPIRTDL